MLGSCEPVQPTSLPEISSNGNGTFGCLLNDEIFVPALPHRWGDPIDYPHYDTTSNYFSVTAHNRYHFDFYVTMRLWAEDFNGTEGTFSLKQGHAGYRDFPIPGFCLIL